MQEGITTLPTEVLEEIMSYISHDDIAALASTSKRLWQVSSPRLRSVIPLFASEKARRCIQYLADNPQRATQTLEIHLSKLVPREERRKPSAWRFNSIRGFFIAAKDRVVPPPFVPVEKYPALGRVFETALRNMTHLRILAVHSYQHVDIWANQVIIPSLRAIFVHPAATSPTLWQWVMRQHSLTTLRSCWYDPPWSLRLPSSPPIRRPSVFPDLHTLITNPVGATEILHKSSVSDLIVHGLTAPSNFNVYPVRVLHEIVRSNKHTPLRRITLSGTLGGICYILPLLHSQDSLPPHVRLFFELENRTSERDLLVHPQLDEVIRTLATLEGLELYMKAVGPDYPDPEVEMPIDTASTEETKVHAWASACMMLRVIRFPSNSKWSIHRENGTLFPHMALQ